MTNKVWLPPQVGRRFLARQHSRDAPARRPHIDWTALLFQSQQPSAVRSGYFFQRHRVAMVETEVAAGLPLMPSHPCLPSGRTRPHVAYVTGGLNACGARTATSATAPALCCANTWLCHRRPLPRVPLSYPYVRPVVLCVSSDEEDRHVRVVDIELVASGAGRRERIAIAVRA